MFKLLGIIIMALLFMLEIIAIGECLQKHIEQSHIDHAQKMEKAISNY